MTLPPTPPTTSPARKPTHTRGYSLIELLVVISIIGFLSSAAFSTFEAGQAQARDAQRLADMRAIEQAFRQFYLDNRRYPDEVNDGVSVTGEAIGVGDDIDAALAPYLDEVPQDPLNDISYDSGTGTYDYGSALYFYSYDPQHWVTLQDCREEGTLNNTELQALSGTEDGGVFGFNFAETFTERDIDTCHGSNMNLDEAVYNRAVGAQSNE